MRTLFKVSPAVLLATSCLFASTLAACGGGSSSAPPSVASAPSPGAPSPAPTPAPTPSPPAAPSPPVATPPSPVVPPGVTACGNARPTGNTVTIASGHPRVLLADANSKVCLQQLVSANWPAAVRFKGMVDGQLGGANYYDFKPWYAALMYQLTGNVAYADYAIARTDAFVASEEALIAQNQRAVVAGDSYLEVGDIIGNVALVYDWTYARLTQAQRTRWITYANQAVWNVWNPTQARWGNTTYAWSGWSVDNPSNNYYYSFLRATMLLGLATNGENAQAAGWITQFRTTKLENQLFPAFNRDLTGGGSREGTGYGTAMKDLWRLYDWWERSTGERIADKTTHTRLTLPALMHNIVPTLDRLAPTGDHARDASAELFDYHRDFLLGLMMLYPQDRLAGIAATLLANSSVPQMTQSFMYFSDFLYVQPSLAPQALAGLSPAYWAPGTGQFAMRSGWDRNATYSNFICGPYTESHAHHDQGSFVIYKNSWLAYDRNIASSSGIEQGEDQHNLVRIEVGGSLVTQVEGAPPCAMLALADQPRFAYGLANVTPVYNGKAGVVKSEREYLFIKPDIFVVFDRVDTSVGARRIWSINFPALATISGDRTTFASGANRLDVYRLAPAGLSTQQPAAGRIEVSDSAGSSTQFLHVIGANGAVGAVARADATGQIGVQISLTDGRSATVRFSATGRGGTLDLRDAGNAVMFNGVLPTTVSTPPLFAN